MSTNMEHIELQTEKGQDMVRVGSNWMVVCDGHGKGKVIKHLRTLPWDELVMLPNPIATLNKSIRTLSDTYYDGATFSMVRLTDDGIECLWVGDSQIRVYADGKEVWRSTNHDRSNEGEIDRVLQEGGHISESWAMSVMDEQTITMEQSKYFDFDGRERLAVSRALGHNEQFMPVVEHHLIPFSEANWKVVVATDGVWDMTCQGDDAFLSSDDTGASDIADLAQDRWNQPWTYKHPMTICTCTHGERISSDQDDIGVAVWRSSNAPNLI